MAEFNYVESDYRFHTPIRYFTANDPYYWEVDNIPLQQLMENDLWLKDQIGNLAKGLGFTREDFAELKPYVNETDNKVRVLPGRFTARINDTTTLTRLMTLTQISGQVFSENFGWRIATYNSTSIKDNIDKITSELGDDAMFMNGLMERAFTYPALDPYNAFINYREQPISWNPVIPVRDLAFWANRQNTLAGTDSEVSTTNFVRYRSGVGFASDTQLQTAFIKFWRGVARTAVVDVPEELEIEIPQFNLADFNYIDENGDTQTRSNAEVRIDLVFLYSKPVDAPSVNVIDKRSTNGYRNITRAELGIVKGAGAILNKTSAPNSTIPSIDDAGQDENGNAQIVASVADANSVSGGFSASGIYGSFPSPDDLMNIAPILAEELEASDSNLVGQTILPIAYVVVRKDGPILNGIQVIQKSSIIDIRPFFRTTELTYGERAGIAASVPPLSMSNPVVSKLELRHQTIEIVNDYTSKINAISNTGTGGSTPANTYPRVVGAGYILGGTTFGVEAVIQHQYLARTPNRSQADLNNDLITRHGYRPSTVIPILPDWDVAKWVYDQNLNSPGSKRNDYINTYHRDRQDSDYGHYATTEKLDRILQLGTDYFRNKVNVHFVKKTVSINRDAVNSWMGDYSVNVRLVNCVPLSSRYNSDDQMAFAGASNIWIDKKPDSFTIYCAWVSDGRYNQLGTTIGGGTVTLNSPAYQRESQNYAGFLVITDDMFVEGGSLSDPYRGEPAAGVALYPSISFDVVGIPSTFAGMPSSLNGVNPVINLT